MLCCAICLRSLIVDDYPRRTGAIRAGLARYSRFSVCGEAAEGQQPKTDFILWDVAMPGMTGWKAASYLKRLIPTVLISPLVYTANWVREVPAPPPLVIDASD